jgi:hypothetical protein
MENNNNGMQLILDAIESLSKRIELLSANEMPKASKSENLQELFAALSKAQAEIKTAGLNAENPFFKSQYADLAEIVKASRPALTKNGLAVIQQILPNEDGQNILHTILGHSSGQWIESRMRILPSKPDIQSLGSYITYLRRYAYASIIGVVVANEDDDAEVAVSNDRIATQKGTGLNTNYNPKDQSYETISKDQLDEIEYELADPQFHDIVEQILTGLKLQSLADIPKSKFLIAIKRIREIKQLRTGR